MDSKKEIKIGDVVICIAEPNLPQFIGSKWIVVDITSSNNLFYCESKEIPMNDPFPFRPNEITLPSSLLEELL